MGKSAKYSSMNYDDYEERVMKQYHYTQKSPYQWRKSFLSYFSKLLLRDFYHRNLKWEHRTDSTVKPVEMPINILLEI